MKPNLQKILPLLQTSGRFILIVGLQYRNSKSLHLILICQLAEQFLFLVVPDSNRRRSVTWTDTMENLISLVNRLQRACTALGDHGEDSALPTLWDALPSIAVVGGQVSTDLFSTHNTYTYMHTLIIMRLQHIYTHFVIYSCTAILEYYLLRFRFSFRYACIVQGSLFMFWFLQIHLPVLCFILVCNYMHQTFNEVALLTHFCSLL